MDLDRITDSIARRVEKTQSSAAEFFEPTIRLGVTGLSRAGKTVFITGLISNLLNRGRMPQLSAHREGRIEAVYLQPQPDMILPRFDYETHLAALLGPEPRWPDSTRSISELRLSFRLKPRSWLRGLTGPRILHLDIIDYPGEWLLDLPLMEKSYSRWSEDTFEQMARQPFAHPFLAALKAVDGGAPMDEGKAQNLAHDFTTYLHRARAEGWTDCTPGRFLLPGDLAGSPVLTFAPVTRPADTPRNSLWREMERRYVAYGSKVVAPFFRDHFARLDRQVVLMDVLGAIDQGPQAVEELRRVMAEILSAFRIGQNGWLSSLIGRRRIERILFAATKADHLHHEQHPALSAITEALVEEARTRSKYAGAEVSALALAGLRATVEEVTERNGQRLPAVRGRLLSSDRQAVMYPGTLPDDPARILHPARQGAETWLDAEYSLMRFAPARMSLSPREGLPHIRLDRAIEFLIGDQL